MCIVLSCEYFYYNTEMLFMKYNFMIFSKITDLALTFR